MCFFMRLFLSIFIFFVLSMIASCYEVEVSVSEKKPSEPQSEESEDLLSTGSRQDLLDYVERLKQKKNHSNGESDSADTDVSTTTGISTGRGNTPLDSDSSNDLTQSIGSAVSSEVSSSSVDGSRSTKNDSSSNGLENNTSTVDQSNQSNQTYQCKNPYLPEFIDSLTTDELESLSDLIDNICNNDNFIRFFQPDFGWQGEDFNRKEYVKFLRQKPLENSLWYDFTIGMAFLLPPLKPSYVNDVFRAYTDNDWFSSNYIHPDNMDVRIQKINRPIDYRGFDIVYNMIMNFKIIGLKYKFQSNFIATRLSEHFTVFTERSLPNNQMHRRHISFLDTSGPKTKFKVFESRQLDSKGLVPIAKAFMEKMDQSMMKAVYDNALIQTNK